ncbi:otolin-1-like isoform X1 [Asterias rubens]|uniref:otolin-1-like isoform X1 n=1 Tax=Asterias rubens TaxID=7604 RepID=UPI001455688E|nr:otolin-1-like isoform X1 [Asterias rubens]
MRFCMDLIAVLGILLQVTLHDAVSTSLVKEQSFCDACCSGPAGVPGIPGTPGEHGKDGESGKRGPKGEPGPYGLKGDQGLTGEKGTHGLVGDKGAKGFFGKLGPRGVPGETGQKGNTGHQGEIGYKGDQGDQGDPGPTGPKGKQGVQGDMGQKGKRGEPGQRGITGSKGRRGDRGLLGLQGPVGPQGVGIRGPKGNTGDKGFKGEPGLPAPELMQCAFMAHCFISSSDLMRGRNGMIPFHETITNIGRYFDLGIDKFTAPIPGTYVFHFSTDFDKGQLKVVKNGQWLVSAKRFSSIVVELQTNDQVGLSLVDDVFFSEAHFYFSGFLLHIQFEYLANNLYVTAH